MISVEYKHNFKFIVIGSSGVGKTSILKRLIDDQFSPDNVSTIGVEYMSTVVEIDGQAVKLQIWDTAGQEVYRGLAPMYYCNACIAIIVYDVTKPEQIDSVSYWIDILHQNVGDSVIIGICGNKTDLECENKVTNEYVQQHVNCDNAVFMQVSAQTGSGIESLFQTLLQKYVASQSKIEVTEKNIEVADGNESKCC